MFIFATRTITQGTMHVERLGKTEEYVYDISLDGTVVNALGMNVLSNTDGFNFQMPTEFRYTDEHPYISTGGGRNSVKDKEYTGVDADVAEFEDLFMSKAFNGGINKNGLGIDEFCTSTINFARKNYADLLDNGKVKLVGNSIKSKKMPIYIEKFLNHGIKLLLNNKGKEFLEYYYDYVEKIYNLQIPLKDIATVGKIKTSLKNYIASTKERTKGGQKKSRQAWYELAIKDGLKVNMGDVIYYINTGTKKATSDIQRVTKIYYMKHGKKCDDYFNEKGEVQYDRNGKPASFTKKLDAEYKKLQKEGKCPEAMTLLEYAEKKYPHLKLIEEDEVIFNCVRLPNEILEDEEDHFCTADFEYNRAKYISMFNSRIRPLLVCFDRKIRTRLNEKGKEVDNILIENPKDRRSFTDAECQLVSGQPFNTSDQDTYEQLMTLEDKEVSFWLRAGKIPPYIEECGLNWEQIVAKYQAHQEELKNENIQFELEQYNRAIESLTKSEVSEFIDDGTLPSKLAKIVDVDAESNIVSKKYGVTFGSVFDLIEKNFNKETEE